MRRKKKDVKNDIILALIFVNVILLIVLFVGIKNKNKNEQKQVNNNQEVKQEVKKEEKIVYLENVKYNNLTVDKEINTLITNYMDLYYKSISNLKYEDMSSLFSTEKEAYKNKTAIDLLIESRLLNKNDMKLSNVKYSLEYKSYEVKDNIYKVKVLEDAHYNFNFIKDITSKLYGIENTFEIEKTVDGYKIKSYDKVQDFYVMIKNSFKDSSYYKKELDDIKDKFIEEKKKEQTSLEKQYNEYKKGYNINISYDHKYDRVKALEYSNKYITSRNSDWSNYDSVGGNCQNYASQILYAGGIQMDYNGDISVQWKHYSSVVDESQTEKGRSYSWTGVSWFYTYAKNNTGKGLVAKVDANYYSAEEADLAQVGYNNEYRHTAVVSGFVKDSEGNIIDLLLNSNTINLENFPLQGYVYPMKRIIKILGYND